MIEGGNAQKEPIEFLFFVVLGGQKRILIDVGSEDKEILSKFGVQNPKTPISLLNTLGIRPEEITDIILTHAHWDHVGALDSFPNAIAWMQEKEFKQLSSLGFSEEKQLIGAYKYSDWKTLQGWRNHNKLNLINGDKEILPCIWTFLAENSHTWGSQFVSVNTSDGIFVFAGDNAYLYDNIEKYTPPSDAISKRNSLKAIKKMHNSASSSKFIIPGHDPKIFHRFICPHPYVANIQ